MNCAAYSDVGVDNFSAILRDLLAQTIPENPSNCSALIPPCSDTLLLDTLLIPIPVLLGGNWYLQGEDGQWSVLQDTALFMLSGLNYRLTILPAANYPGPDELVFSLEELNANGEPIALSDTISLSLQWRDEWGIDTLILIDSLYTVLDADCVHCSASTLNMFPIVTPSPPPPPCNPLTIIFYPPPEDQVLYQEIACGSCVETPLGQICESGQFVATLLNEQGCPYTVTVIVADISEQPEGMVLQTGTYTCSTPSVTLAYNHLSAGSYSYEWQFEDGELLGSDTPITATMPGIYTCIVENNLGCTTVLTVVVEDETEPVLLAIDATIDCNTSSTLLEICPGVTVDITEVVSPYVCEDELGCPLEVHIGVFIDTLPPVVDTLELVCAEDNSTYSVLLDPVATSEYIINSATGLENIPSCAPFDIEISANNGCSTHLEGVHCCDCITSPGTLMPIQDAICDSCFTLVYDPLNEVLEDGDMVQFMLHTQSNPMEGEVLSVSLEPYFCFDPIIMNRDVPYFVTALVGNVDGSGVVNVNAPCSIFSNTQSIKIINDNEAIEDRIYVPNAFSPNGDNINDLFMPHTPHVIVDYKFMIFNRWGDLIFNSERQGEGWNGNFIKESPMDPAVMVWILSGSVENCAGKLMPFFMSGDVVIIR
ncbi:MAG: gliding motility-associated C-terminal domain-containing protein [Saprospiraceae bacterium]